MTELQIPSKLENRQILDLCPFGDSGKFVVILYDKNHIVIFDLVSGTAVFKTSFAEASDLITNVQFVESRPQFVVEDIEEASNLISGYLLLTESKVITKKSETSKQKQIDQSSSSISRTKLLRKLHLVEIQQVLNSSKKGNEVKDKLE